jgi:hypothetical protein
VFELKYVVFIQQTALLNSNQVSSRIAFDSVIGEPAVVLLNLGIIAKINEAMEEQ